MSREEYCECGDVPFRHLDHNGHVPSCWLWTWDMDWAERLGHNFAIAGGLFRAIELAARRARWVSDYYEGWYDSYDKAPWSPGEGMAAP